MSTETHSDPSPSQNVFDFWKQFVPGPKSTWDRFELRKDGVYHIERQLVPDPEKPGEYDGSWVPVRICSWLEVSAMSRNDHGSAWGKVLRWTDFDGKSHQWSTPASLLVEMPDRS